MRRRQHIVGVLVSDTEQLSTEHCVLTFPVEQRGLISGSLALTPAESILGVYTGPRGVRLQAGLADLHQVDHIEHLLARGLVSYIDHERMIAGVVLRRGGGQNAGLRLHHQRQDGVDP